MREGEIKKRKREGEKNDRGYPRIYSANRDETVNAFDRKQRRPMETTTRGHLMRGEASERERRTEESAENEEGRSRRDMS